MVGLAMTIFWSTTVKLEFCATGEIQLFSIPHIYTNSPAAASFLLSLKTFQ
jgi:hypothetical protein